MHYRERDSTVEALGRGELREYGRGYSSALMFFILACVRQMKALFSVLVAQITIPKKCVFFISLGLYVFWNID